MKNIIYYILLLVVPLVQADTFNVTGTCLTDNISNNTYCGDVSTIVENITIVENVTNVTNITVQECNATNATLWANSTGIFNNATITCLSNLTTIVQNTTYVINATVVTGCPTINSTMYANSSQTQNNWTVNCLSNYAPADVCNFNDTITPTGGDQYEQNISGLNVHILPILWNYCFENRNERQLAPYVWRSDKCNDTFIADPSYINQTVGCPPPVACPIQPACQVTDCQPIVFAAERAFNSSLAGKDALVGQYAAATNSLPAMAENAAKRETGNITDLWEIALLVAFGFGFIYYEWKKRQPSNPMNIRKLSSSEALAELKEKYIKKEVGNE